MLDCFEEQASTFSFSFFLNASSSYASVSFYDTVSFYEPWPSFLKNGIKNWKKI